MLPLHYTFTMDSPTKKVHSPDTTGSGDINGSPPYTNGNQTSTSSKRSYENVKSVSANRQGIEEAFRSFGQLVTASRRPLPTQNGDGTYNTAKRQTGLREDLKVIKLKGMSSSRQGYVQNVV